MAAPVQYYRGERRVQMGVGRFDPMHNAEEECGRREQSGDRRSQETGGVRRREVSPLAA
jgi:hypothetical protein